MAIKKKMQMGGKAKPLGGGIGDINRLKGKDLELEKKTGLKFGEGGGPSIDKSKAPAPKPKMKMGGAMKKAKDGTEFGMLSVKAGVDKNPNPTAADRIAGATKGKSSMMKMGGKMAKQAATAIAMKKAGVKPKAMMKKGGTMKKCKSGCY
jgi:hypothetical protein